MDLTEGYAEYEERRERGDVTLELDRWSDQDEDPSMEVEEVPQRDPSAQTDTMGSKGDEPPATKASPKALPRASYQWYSLPGPWMVVHGRTTGQTALTLRTCLTFPHHPVDLDSRYRSILTGNIRAWFGNSTKQKRQALQRVVLSAERITYRELPDLQTIYYKRCQTKAKGIVKDPTHPNNRLFSMLSSRKQFRSLKTNTERVKRSFFPQAIWALNWGN
ncbi:hypothetical protein P4O66_021131 [Electrophorus voltai]|uniref:Uncharacterized protein n=1 Tax=Electrophorus voltai TaxID=2609070 RepID=A0AAD9E6C4_9TELE|nr:hypothetical protein P4O66_021131 [Electrophorus voltai]